MRAVIPPIAKTLDCDLGLVARDLANLRATGHASGDLETQCLGGRLRIRRDRNIDEISHVDLPVSLNVVSKLRTNGPRQERCSPPGVIGLVPIFRDNAVKNPLESVHRKIKLVMRPPVQARPGD